MKKFLNFPLILAFIFSFIISVCSLTGCEVMKIVEANTYSLKVDAGNVFITDPPRGEDGVADKRFKGGEVVTFSIGVVYDAEVIIQLNGQRMEEATDFDQDDYSNGVKHSFVMPFQDSVLSFSIVNGFYSLDHAPLFHYYDWIKYLSEDEIESAIYSDPAVGTPSLGNLNKYYSADQDEIHSLVEWLNSTNVERVELHRVEPGTVYNTITIKTIHGETYKISANDNYISYSSDDNYSYRLSSPLPVFETEEYCTITDFALSDMKVMKGNDDMTDLFNINKLYDMEFAMIDAFFPEVVNEYNVYRFKTSTGEIVFHTDTTFELIDHERETAGAYQSVNAVTFASLKKST